MKIVTDATNFNNFLNGIMHFQHLMHLKWRCNIRTNNVRTFKLHLMSAFQFLQCRMPLCYIQIAHFHKTKWMRCVCVCECCWQLSVCVCIILQLSFDLIQLMACSSFMFFYSFIFARILPNFIFYFITVFEYGFWLGSRLGHIVHTMPKWLNG